MTILNLIKMSVLRNTSGLLLFWTVPAQAVEQDRDDRRPLSCPQDSDDYLDWIRNPWIDVAVPSSDVSWIEFAPAWETFERRGEDHGSHANLIEVSLAMGVDSEWEEVTSEIELDEELDASTRVRIRFNPGFDQR
jgi:hypothetical protein